MNRMTLYPTVILTGLFSISALAAPPIATMRLPNGGVQPQAAVDSKHVAHLIYLKGDAAHCDVYYIRSTNGGMTWSSPIRVNHTEGSAIAIGTVRGAQLAIGKGGRVHVAWMGSDRAQPRAPGKATPMLYTRINDEGNGFEPERNVITSKVGLDGGGSVAADEVGNVYVAWHAPADKGGTEQDRRVWVAKSSDDGKTFAPEVAVSKADTGACGCCGMKVFAADGKLFALYRGASQQINRGMFLLETDSRMQRENDRQIAPMRSGVCVMSTSDLAAAPHGLLAAWETNEQVFWSHVDANHPDQLEIKPVPGPGGKRKHPAVTCDDRGNVLVAWAEGTGWNRGGSVAWQLYEPEGNPTTSGKVDNLPVWSEPAAFWTPAGGFVVAY